MDECHYNKSQLFPSLRYRYQAMAPLMSENPSNFNEFIKTIASLTKHVNKAYLSTGHKDAYASPRQEAGKVARSWTLQ
jgi:hypothetical protein